MEVSGQLYRGDSANGTIGVWVGPQPIWGFGEQNRKRYPAHSACSLIKISNALLQLKQLAVNFLSDVFKIEAIAIQGPWDCGRLRLPDFQPIGTLKW
jgi:hypothetical protein